jgi:LmbE family N-acetylglucosaminyl deacetylase
MYLHLRQSSCLAFVLIAVFATGAASGQTVGLSMPGIPVGEDAIKFRDGGGQTLSVILKEMNGTIEMTWPASTTPDWDTAMLRVVVSAITDVSEPFVEIAAGGHLDRQYFRTGDAGTRWLNLSFLHGRVPAGTPVTLRGEGVNIVAGDAPLRLFANHLDLSRSVLILAPHPDDAEIAAFGLYSFRRATIVTVTAGNAGVPSYQSAFSDLPSMYQFKGRIRLIDSITVPWQGGIPPERAFNMGYFDARLADMHDRPDETIPEMYGPNTDIGIYRRHNIGTLLSKGPRASTWRNLVNDLKRVLNKVRPDVIVAPHPQFDGHPDHKFSTVALAEALTQWKRPVNVLLYTNHADQSRYPYGPAGTIMSLPPHLLADVLLDRVYSYPLSPEVQRSKLFALDSMHGLRMSPSRLYQLLVGGDAKANVDPPSAGIAFYRRGIRSNELFFVYDRASLGQMIEAFLATWRTRARP